MSVEFRVGDCRTELRKLSNVNCVITSPPYNLNKEYDTYKDNLSQSEYEKFTLEWLAAARSSMQRGSRIIINIPTVTQFGGNYEFLYPLYANWIKQSGFTLMEEISWIKVADLNQANTYHASGNTGWGSFASPSSPFCRSIREYILVAHNGTRKKEGLKENIDISKEEFVSWTHDAWGILGKSNPLHPAVWPAEIPYRLLKLYTYRGDFVVDPFCGTGTTMHVAQKLARNGIGFDISELYIKEATKELDKIIKQKTLSNFST